MSEGFIPGSFSLFGTEKLAAWSRFLAQNTKAQVDARAQRWYRPWYHRAGRGKAVTPRCRKLIAKARENPQGLRFAELKRLCECIGMRLVRTKGSHYIYRLENPESVMISIQETKTGEAKPYQVRQVLQCIDDLGLYTEEEE